MIKKYSLVFVAFLCFVLSGFGQTYNQITSLTELTDGYYVIAESEESYAMNNSHNDTYLDRTAISPTASTITNPPATIIWRIETNGSGRTIYSENSSKYISYTGISNNVQIVDNVTSNNQRWNITYSGGVFIFSNVALTSRDLQYNSGAPRFACYTGSQRDLVLYKLDAPVGPIVTYNGNGNTGGSVPTDGNNPYTSGDTVTVLGNTGSLTNTCNTFNNWNTAADGSGTSYSVGNTFTISANTTLYAQWTPTGNSVTFDANGGTGSMTPQTDCATANLTTNTFTYAGFTFNSWNTVADGSGTTYVDGAAYNFAADMTLFAQWDVYVGPCLSTSFESGEPSGWDNNDSYYNSGTSNSGSQKAGMNDNNDWIRTEQLLDPSDLSFWARASSSGSTFAITIQYSADGTTWLDSTQIVANGSNSGDITDSYQQFNVNLNLTGNYYLRWFMDSRSGGSFYLDDVEVFCGTSTPQPELQLVDDTATNQNCGYTIDFGTQAVSTSTDLTFDIENVGSADLVISSFGITGDYSIVSPATTLTIVSGNLQTVTVRFTPSATGTRTGVLTINNNDSNESACTVNLTGVGFVPAPEIDVERNSGGSIPNGAAANIGYNTIFASTVMGNSSAPKTYHVSNEGTANLNLTSITSSNPSEFAISLNPGASTITPGTEVDFEITFSPTGVGVRTAIITIISNDADENPYTFNVQGNGDCAAGTLTFFPNNGPVGTVVNVTSSNYNFGGSTTATVNGVPASVNIISNNEMEVTIPTGAATGNLEINDDLGCLSSDLFIVVDKLISDCEGSSGSTPSDLFISEVTDHGSGSHSYVEIFNGTGAAINLTNYEIRLHNNGATTPTHIIPLVGTVASNDVFVLAFGSGDATDSNSTHAYDQSDNATGINEDDHIRLYNSSTNTWIDLWGDISGNVFTVASKNYTYRRKNSGIIAPSTTWNVNDWDAFTPVDYSDIGSYDFSTGTPPSITVEPVLPSTNCNLTASISVTATEGYSGGNPLAYQWYYSASGDTGWTPVPNAAPYSGYNSATLDISNTLNLDGYQYYCQVREDDALCFKASNAVKLHVTKTVWDGTDWTNSTPPDEFTVAVIDGTYDTGLHGDIDACQLIINSGVDRTLNVENSTYVRVVNNVINNGSITVQTHGAFVQDGVGANAGTFTNNGSASVIKYTDILNDWYEYTYWSSPVVNQLINAATPDTPNSRRFYFETANYLDQHTDGTANGIPDDIDDDGNDWQNASGDIMESGRGYATTSSPLGSFPGIDQVNFNGEFFTGDLLKPIITNGFSGDNDWNLVGNPYASAIAFNDLYTENSAIIDGAAYLWSQALPPLITNPGNEVLNFNQADYAIITTGSGNIAGGSIVIPTSFIPSGQGFFVRAINSGGNLRFTNSMRRADNSSNNQFFRSGNSNQDTSTNQANRLWVNLTSDNGVFNQILVAYVDGATDGDDGWGFDAPRNFSSGLASTIYTSIENGNHSNYAIQGKAPSSLSLDEVIPLGFKTNISEPTIYTLSIAQLEGEFMTGNTIYLKDKLLQVIHDLSATDYLFTAGVGEFNARFEIVFKDSFLSVHEEELTVNNLTIIELQNGEVQFTVPSQHKIQSVEIIDLLGRTVYNLKGNSSTETYNLSNLSQATYVARVTLTNGQVLTKKAVKRK